jgi:hypothetical protein
VVVVEEVSVEVRGSYTYIPRVLTAVWQATGVHVRSQEAPGKQTELYYTEECPKIFLTLRIEGVGFVNFSSLVKCLSYLTFTLFPYKREG